mmetsp:Transcript_32752/g.98931  ORF Transcript_32752/g.98931 Transcript_32752/m.98931 type:complete len:243 (-) Transcript_32752:1746-2474(-)
MRFVACAADKDDPRPRVTRRCRCNRSEPVQSLGALCRVVVMKAHYNDKNCARGLEEQLMRLVVLRVAGEVPDREQAAASHMAPRDGKPWGPLVWVGAVGWGVRVVEERGGPLPSHRLAKFGFANTRVSTQEELWAVCLDGTVLVQQTFGSNLAQVFLAPFLDAWPGDLAPALDAQKPRNVHVIPCACQMQGRAASGLGGVDVDSSCVDEVLNNSQVAVLGREMQGRGTVGGCHGNASSSSSQ